ncbi:AAA family ATPase [Georgenia sp. SUBG003]|uniref:AAA family ATPase n=1 Tax=Georgenia sp. SUBG003 TaxID=1497974 RepID=UPI003AB13E15
MIEQVRIENLGVIAGAELDLAPTFTVITGETGAGKTMVLTSLALLLGGKADPALVRHGAERAVVEGAFVVAPEGPAAARAEEAGAAVEDGELIVARTVPARRGAPGPTVGGAHRPPTAVLRRDRSSSSSPSTASPSSCACGRSGRARAAAVRTGVPGNRRHRSTPSGRAPTPRCSSARRSTRCVTPSSSSARGRSPRPRPPTARP